ncbi:hypothetical protein ACVBKF_02960 [Shewanella sp. 0m-11]
MKEYLPVIVSVLAGLFALFSAITTWRLKHNSDENVRTALAKDSAYKELKDLYVKVHEMFEELIKETKTYKSSDLSSRFSKLTAELHMLASSEVVEVYLEIADDYSDWAYLYNKAYPAPEKIGDSSYIKVQYPDPTLKYQEPEKLAYDKFYKGYQGLIKTMRSEVAINA